MIKFNTYQILKHKALWLWPGFFILFIIAAAIWGSIQPAAGAPFLLTIASNPVPIWFIISLALGPIAIIGVIVFPKHYADTLEPERASLIFSKSASRTEFYFSSFTSMLIVSFLFTLFMVVVFAIFAGIDAGIFPIWFYIASLILGPFFLLLYYVSVVFFITITKSRLAGALIGYFILGITTFLLHGDKFLSALGFHSSLINGILTVFSYIIPSTAGLQELWKPILQHGFTMFEWGLFGHVIASCVPFFIVSYWLVTRREF